MLQRTLRASARAVSCLAVLLTGCTGEGSPVDTTVAEIRFETLDLPTAGAGQFYDAQVRFTTGGGAALPDRFELSPVGGALPPGISLTADRADTNGDGTPDADGTLTGHARLVGFPRREGRFPFVVRAISTGSLGASQDGSDLADLTASRTFEISVSAGSVAILNPTAEEGTVDPAVPQFPEVIDFVNPANPQAFFSFAFLVAGGSGNNLLNLYLPRELELSVFDAAVVAGDDTLETDTNESATTGDPVEVAFGDGGIFALQAGNGKMQLGGFQSPRGPVGTITTLDPAWFQRTPGAGGPPLDSRRNAGESFPGGDAALGTERPVLFSDYFSDLFEGTHPTFVDPPGGPVLQRRKYPFVASEYENAFLVEFVDGVDVTPLQFRVIAEAIDTRGTPTKVDDVISRRAYIARVRIPDIIFDTVQLPAGTAGVDYNEFVNASGGVPPLQFDLEHVDGVSGDLEATPIGPGQIDKAAVGLELDRNTGQFFGVPNASGAIDLTVRVFATVMNPIQNSDDLSATPNPGEFNGLHPVTNKRGIHKTLTVPMATPTAPVLGNASLTPGVDGFAYPGDRLRGVGGVAKLVPNPVGFVGTYPSAQVARTYAWTAAYERDTSHGGDVGTPDPSRPLPNDLVLDGDPLSGTNGEITGITLDRGFHPVHINQQDFYIGDASGPDLASFRQTVSTTLALSVSPDIAVYARGATGAGFEPTGVLSPTDQMGEARMVPLMLASSIYSLETAQQPQRLESLPNQLDLLPVMLANGGSDAHNNKSIPSLSGTWPAESGHEVNWAASGTQAWIHSQQETVWLQAPNRTHTRVFLWAETRLASFTNGTWTARFQQYVSDGQRGVLVVNPLSGDFWVPAILENTDPAHGSQFGAENVFGGSSTALNGGTAGYDGPGYWKGRQRPSDVPHDRAVHLQGLGTFIENYGTAVNTGTGWFNLTAGRTATSVAMSSDGAWCATAMPGGDGQKILLWRTDKAPIPAAMIGQDFVTGLTGRDSNGDPLLNASCIFDLGGEDAGGVTLLDDQALLLPDSLMFVDGGLLFLSVGQLDHVFGVSLVDGHLSSVDLNGPQRSEVNGAGLGPTVNADRGQYPPDQDYLRGPGAAQGFSVQFAFTGNQPAAGATGPDKVAFVAGDNRDFITFTDLGNEPRDGFRITGNRPKALFFLEVTNGATGLELGGSTLRDLTGDDPQVFGDFLTPGRPGEEQDWLTISPDGRYVAVVRDQTTSDSVVGTFGRLATFHTGASNGTSAWQANDDILLLSTDGSDLHSGSGTQHVAYLGSASFTNGTSASPAGMPGYAIGRSHLNAGFRRINGVHFGADNRTLIFNYAGTQGAGGGAGNDRHPKNSGNANSWGVNPTATGTFGFGVQSSVRVHFRTTDDDPIDFGSGSTALWANNLDGLTTVGPIGPTRSPFGSTSASNQLFWATFKSHNGNFLYYISDRLTGTNHMVGFNISGAPINGRDPYDPFRPHAATVGFQQFEVNAINYESRFAAVPAGVVYPPSGRDGAGILFVIANDASATATSSTDLEVYVMDADIGGDMIALTSDVTTGAGNAINHLYVSAGGNTLIGQRAATTASSRDNRATLNGNSDLFAVTNVHAVLQGATPTAFVLSGGASHGSTVSFIGEGSATGPQALVFSAGPSGDNRSWDDRTLRTAILAPGVGIETLDPQRSHYTILSASRRLDDDPATSD